MVVLLKEYLGICFIAPKHGRIRTKISTFWGISEYSSFKVSCQFLFFYKTSLFWARRHFFQRAFCPERSTHGAAGVEGSLPLIIKKDQLWWMPWAHSFLTRLAPVLPDTLSLVESLQFATGHSSSRLCLTPLRAPGPGEHFHCANAIETWDSRELSNHFKVTTLTTLLQSVVSGGFHCYTALQQPGTYWEWSDRSWCMAALEQPATWLVWSHLSA